MTDLAFSPPALDDPPVLLWPDEPGCSFEGPTSSNGFSLWIDDAGWRFPCVYTVGLTDYGLPELVFFGRDTIELRQQWEVVQHRLGELIAAGGTVSNDRFDALVSPVSDENCAQLEETDRRYGVGGFKAVQLYWVVGRANGRPTGGELSFLAGQPYLGRGTLRELLADGDEWVQ
ncbi:hypothetical protein [Arthrobacter roseus]|uniref:hypothetical protein n=1 Tax=Arthrobacter roseus TaxID=136274 RepID=UPI001963A5A4|nr:hypothetical protein [Arthrobacter roseus]MBM7847211.1 hypothetical protein [Arthrobacter roseus]